MPAVQSFTATEFMAKCLDIFDQLAGRKQGLHGFLRGSVIPPIGLELTAPSLDETLVANEGRLHE